MSNEQASTIKQELKNWDGKSSADIKEIYYRFYNASHDDGSFGSQIIELTGQDDLQIGATWLLKHHLEESGKIDESDFAKIFQLLPTLEQWGPKLHILQCLPFMQIAKSEKKLVEMFLRSCLTDENKFVRAWAYNGFYEISMQYPEYKEEAKQFFEMAMRDEAASVKARIRNILKKGF